MIKRTVHSIFFSPSGTTKQIVTRISFDISLNVLEHDLLKNKVISPINFSSEEIVIVGMPVFGGRIPGICRDQLASFHGKNTPAIICAIYGNREYDDALLELQELMQKQGFLICAAGAFVAQHSIFNLVAANRPDKSDFVKIDEFANMCMNKLENENSDAWKTLEVKGNHPFRASGRSTIKPTTSSECNQCGACVKICPVNAIDSANPEITDEDKCISCSACIAICPQKARIFNRVSIEAYGDKFKSANSVRKEPEYFI